MESKSNQGVEKKYSQYPYQQVNSDDIEKEGFQYFMRDTIPKSLNDGCYILNTDKNSGGGEHWQCFILQHPQIFFFGSYGATSKYRDRPSKELIAFGKRNGFDTIYCSEDDIQYPASWLCGNYALMIAQIFKSKIGRITEQSFDSTIRKEFGTKPNDANVKKITTWSKKEGIL